MTEIESHCSYDVSSKSIVVGSWNNSKAAQPILRHRPKRSNGQPVTNKSTTSTIAADEAPLGHAVDAWTTPTQCSKFWSLSASSAM